MDDLLHVHHVAGAGKVHIRVLVVLAALPQTVFVPAGKGRHELVASSLVLSEKLLFSCGEFEKVRTFQDTPAIRGIIAKVSHLVKVID